jgi:hypothetical protein
MMPYPSYHTDYVSVTDQQSYLTECFHKILLIARQDIYQAHVDCLSVHTALQNRHAMNTRNQEGLGGSTQAEQVLQRQSDTLQLELVSIKNSLSWRITAPLRWLANLVVSPAAAFSVIKNVRLLDCLIRWGIRQPRLVTLVLRVSQEAPVLRVWISRRIPRTNETSASSQSTEEAEMTISARRIRSRITIENTEQAAENFLVGVELR